MKKLLLFIFLVILSCTKDEDGQELPSALKYELAENIIGKWDIQNSAKKVSTCRIFNLVFSQDEFIINYTGGHIKGTYTVDSEMKISLTSTGDITNISITNGNISFNISIDNCDVSANGVKDNNYKDGECTTFLECLDGFYFSEDGEIDDAVITFFNKPTEKWYEAYYLYSDCFEIENPFTSLEISGFSVEIIQNTKDFLIVKTIDGESIAYGKLIYFEDGSLSIGSSDTFDGVYEIDDSYLSISQAKVFELQGILESSQECTNSNEDLQNCNNQDIINLFNSLKIINIGDIKEFSFGNYYKTWESDATPTGGTFEGITYTQINFNEVNELNGIGNEVSFYFRKDIGDLLFVISLNSVLENGVRTYTQLRRFYAPNYPSDGPLNYEHSNYCELWDAASNYTNDLPVTSVESNYTFVPDDKFEQALIDLGYDDVLNDYVLTDNIIGVEVLNLSDKNIYDLTGIGGFTALKNLYLLRNKITEIDVSKNLNLENLSIGRNYLTEIDVSKNINLRDLSLGDNLLTDIDVSKNSNLEVLSLGSPPEPISENLNRIQNLDLSNNNKLIRLGLSNNNIKGTIETSNLSELMTLVVDGNFYLDNLDLSKNTKLEWLQVGYNSSLHTIDISNQSILKYFSIRASSQSLVGLDISNNNELIIFDATFSSLDCIKVSQFQLDNQINNNRIGDKTTDFYLPIGPTLGQLESSISWTKDSNTIFSLDCN